MPVITKKERIEIRISLQDKEMIERAAECNNLSVASYVIAVVLKQAKMDLKNDETIMLNNKERELFIKALSGQEEPNQALKDLFK